MDHLKLIPVVWSSQGHVCLYEVDGLPGTSIVEEPRRTLPWKVVRTDGGPARFATREDALAFLETQ
jgi:hypothetical protein